MFAVLIRLARRLWNREGGRTSDPGIPTAPAPTGQVAVPMRDASDRAAGDERLLQCARVQWHLGDWEALMALSDAVLQTHPDAAELALLKASAAQQLDCHDNAARYIRIARAAGCDKRQAARILLAGVHNSLGRALALAGDQAGAEHHFRLAVGSALPGLDSPLVAQARARNETGRLVSALAAPAIDGRADGAAPLVQP